MWRTILSMVRRRIKPRTGGTNTSFLSLFDECLHGGSVANIKESAVRWALGVESSRVESNLAIAEKLKSWKAMLARGSQNREIGTAYLNWLIFGKKFCSAALSPARRDKPNSMYGHQKQCQHITYIGFIVIVDIWSRREDFMVLVSLSRYFLEKSSSSCPFLFPHCWSWYLY